MKQLGCSIQAKETKKRVNNPTHKPEIVDW